MERGRLRVQMNEPFDSKRSGYRRLVTAFKKRPLSIDWSDLVGAPALVGIPMADSAVFASIEIAGDSLAYGQVNTVGALIEL